DTTQITSALNRTRAEPGDPAGTLAKGGHAPAIAMGRPARGEGQSEHAAWAVRRLTPTECSRLQGFLDDYLSSVTYRGKPPADGPMYKALGNSMAVSVMRAIGTRIAMVDALAAERIAA